MLSPRCAIVLFMSLFTATVAPAHIPAAHSHNVSGTFSLDKSEVATGEPMLITYRVANNTGSPIHFTEARSRGSVQRWKYQFTATDANGRLVSPPEGGMIISGLIQSVTVAPGKTSLLHIDLSDWFQIKTPGSYTIHCKRILGVTSSGSTKSVHEKQVNIVTSANLKLEILPVAKD